MSIFCGKNTFRSCGQGPSINCVCEIFLYLSAGRRRTRIPRDPANDVACHQQGRRRSHVSMHGAWKRCPQRSSSAPLPCAATWDTDDGSPRYTLPGHGALTAAQRAAYERDGYIVLRKLIQPATLAPVTARYWQYSRGERAPPEPVQIMQSYFSA